MQDANSGLPLATRGKNKKVVVFLTDGMPNSMPDIQQMINYANMNDISVYPVVIGFNVPTFLNDLAINTNGFAFGNVRSTFEAENIYKQILKIAVTQRFCEVTWKSDLECGDIEFAETVLNIAKKIQFQDSDSLLAKLELIKKYYYLGEVKQGYKFEIKVPVIGVNDTVLISSMKFLNGKFSLKTGTSDCPIKVKPGEQIDLEVNFTANNLDSLNDVLEIITNTCEKYYVDFYGTKKEESSVPHNQEKDLEFRLYFLKQIVWEN